MSTPVPQDLLSRFMASAFDEKNLIGVPTGFQAFFGRPETGAETIFSPDANQVDIDIIRGNERISALIPRGTVSRSLGSLQKNQREEQFSSFSRKYPLGEEEGDITADKLLQRVAGENPYQRQSRMDRLRYHGLKIHTESIRKLGRLFEVLAAQSITEGVQDAIVGTTNTDLQYDFRRNTNHIFTVDTSWAGGTANILADIDEACGLIRANGKMMPDMAILGTTAMNSLVTDTTVAAIADNRRFEFIRVGERNPAPAKFQRFIDGGMIPQGSIRTPSGYSLWLFTYLDVYTNASGVATKYLADDKVVVAASQARCDRYFGPPENLPMIPMREQLYREFLGFDPTAPPLPAKLAGSVIDPAMFYCDAYVSSDWKRLTIRTQVAPIFATTMTDGFVTMDTEP